MKRTSIARRLIVVMTLCMTLILVVTLGFNYLRSRTLIEHDLKRDARTLTQALAGHIQRFLLSVTKATEGLQLSLEEGQSALVAVHGALNVPAASSKQDDIEEAALGRLLERTLASNPEIYGLAAAFEPDDKRGDKTALFAPYVYHDSDGAIHSKRLENIYDYTDRDWYRAARECQCPTWSEPYFGEAGQRLMASFSLPFFTQQQSQRRFAGLLVADVALDRLTKALNGIGLFQTGFAFLLSENGTLIVHSMPQLAQDETIFTLASKASEPAMRLIGQRMLRGESGFVRHTKIFGFGARLYYAPIPTTGWTLVTVFPEQELFAHVHHLTLMTALIGALGILVAMVTIALIAHSITRPLCALVPVTQSIAAGDFDAKLPDIHHNDEIGALTRAFAAMEQALRTHIRQLIDATAAKERMDSELQVARRIQLGILPQADGSELDTRISVHAVIRPAREVGGDFYDFFPRPDGRLCFVIADVSDKGVPAALFMAVTRTLIKAHAQSAEDPGQILTKVNRELAHDNAQNMFVTIFCALLDPATGELHYANAGHNPPLRLSQEGQILTLPTRPQLVLGVMETTVYHSETSTLTSEERLFLFTDGVTEARNAAGAFYSNERLEQRLRQLHAHPSDEIVAGVLAGLDDFSDPVAQSDDITMLLVTRLACPLETPDKAQ